MRKVILFIVFFGYATFETYAIMSYVGIYPLLLGLSGIWFVTGLIKLAMKAMKFRKRIPVRQTGA